MIDVIILTDSKDPIGTQKTISSIKNSVEARIILVSKREDYHIYRGVDTYVVIKEEFNYNRFINHAMEYVKRDWVLISNDDVVYDRFWFDEMQEIMDKRKDIHSLSPIDPRLHLRYYNNLFLSDEDCVEGYNVTEHVSGWAILVQKSVLEKISPFDEQFDMYYQDNDYAQMLIKNGFKHAVVVSSHAHHMGTELIGIPYSEEKTKKLAEDEHKFRSKWNIYK